MKKYLALILIVASVVGFPMSASAVVTGTNLTTGVDSDGGSGATTASVSPTANRLLLLTVSSRTGITADPNEPTVTGNGLTWVPVNGVVYDNTSSSRRRITVFRALGASPSTGTISIDFGGQAQTHVLWSLDEFSGVDTSGTNGSGAVVQSATNFDPNNTLSTLTVTLGAFSSTNNATFGAFSIFDGTAAFTVGSGFTSLGDIGTGTSLHILSEYKSTNDTSVDASWAGTSEVGGVAIEIKSDTVAPTAVPTVSIQGAVKIGGPVKI